MSMILYNAIQTPDGTILVSRNRHDYREHKDKNGEIYMVDGGMAYLRRSVNMKPFKELSIDADDSIEDIREVFTQGIYTTKGKLLYIKLKDMGAGLINHIIDGGLADSYIKNIYIDELKYRKDNNI